MFITPDRNPDQLSSYAESIGLEGALFAKDTANTKNIGLNNIWQFAAMHNGKTIQTGQHNIGSVKQLIDRIQPTYRYEVSGLENPTAKQLWWLVERGHPEGIKTLVKAAKRSPIKEEAQKILDVVDVKFQTKAAELMSAGATIDTYEAMQALLSESKGLDLKDLAKRFKELNRDKTIKNELKAKAAYQKIVSSLLGSGNEKKRTQAAKAFAQLAKALPDTKYGKLAAKQ